MDMTEAQMIILILCAIMAFAGYKIKQPGLSFLAMIGIFIFSFDYYTNVSPDLLLLALLIAAAIIQFFITLNYSLDGRRR